MHDIGFLHLWYADINKLITMYTNIKTDIFCQENKASTQLKLTFNFHSDSQLVSKIDIKQEKQHFMYFIYYTLN